MVPGGVQAPYFLVLNPLRKLRLFDEGNRAVNVCCTEEDDSRLQTNIKRAPEQRQEPLKAGSH